MGSVAVEDPWELMCTGRVGHAGLSKIMDACSTSATADEMKWMML